MAFALVRKAQFGYADTAASIACNYTAAVTAGNLLVAVVFWQDQSDAVTASVTDNGAGGAWTEASGKGNLAGWYSAQIFCKVAQAGDAAVGSPFLQVIATFDNHSTGNPAAQSIHIFEFSGNATSSVVDAAVATSGSGANPSVNLTTDTTVAGDLLVGGLWSGAGSVTAGSGFATIDYCAHTFYYDSTEHKLDAGSPGTKAIAFTYADTGSWILVGAAFKPASGAEYTGDIAEDVTASDSLITLQALVPASDVSNAGSYVPLSGSDLYAMINARGSGNYISSPVNPSGAVCEVMLSEGDALNLYDAGWIDVDVEAVGGDIDFTVALREGSSTEIATTTETISTGTATVVLSLTPTEVEAAKAATDLRLRFTATAA